MGCGGFSTNSPTDDTSGATSFLFFSCCTCSVPLYYCGSRSTDKLHRGTREDTCLRTSECSRSTSGNCDAAQTCSTHAATHLSKAQASTTAKSDAETEAAHTKSDTQTSTAKTKTQTKAKNHSQEGRICEAKVKASLLQGLSEETQPSQKESTPYPTTCGTSTAGADQSESLHHSPY